MAITVICSWTEVAKRCDGKINNTHTILKPCEYSVDDADDKYWGTYELASCRNFDFFSLSLFLAEEEFSYWYLINILKAVAVLIVLAHRSVFYSISLNFIFSRDSGWTLNPEMLISRCSLRFFLRLVIDNSRMITV